MANNQANRITLPLNSQINLSRDKTQVENFDKFNRKNGTIYGGNLASFFTKSESNDTENANKIVIDSRNNKYTIDNSGYFCINGEQKQNVSVKGGVKFHTEYKNYICAFGEHHFYTIGEDKSKLYYENKETDDAYSVTLDTTYEKCIGLKMFAEGALSNPTFRLVYLLEDYEYSTSTINYKVLSKTGTVFSKSLTYSTNKIDYDNILIQLGKITIEGTNYLGVTVYQNAGENVKDVKFKTFLIVNYSNSGTCAIKNFTNFTATKSVTATIDNTKIGFVNYRDDTVYLYNLQNYASIDKTKGVAYIGKIDLDIGTHTVTISGDNVSVSIQYLKGYEDTQTISAIISGYTILDGFYLQTVYYKTTSGKAQFLQSTKDEVTTQALFSVDDTDSPASIIDGKCYYQWIGTGTTHYKIIKNAEIIGIAHYRNTELTEFFGVNKNFPVIMNSYYIDGVNSTFIYYSNTSNKGCKVQLYVAPEILGIVNDRYVIINSVFETNAYDIEKKVFYNWCSSAMLLMGYGIMLDDNIIDSTETRLLPNISEHTEITLQNLTDYKKYVCAMSYNNMYEVTNIPFMGLQLAPFYYYKIDYGSKNSYQTIHMIKNYGEVDFYESLLSENLYPVYVTTFKGYQRYQNSQLQGLTYTVGDDIIMPPSLTSEFIFSYLNRNYVINGSKGYPLIQWNNDFVFGYTSLSYIENIKAVFVIQTMTYFITDKKLIYAQYSGNELVQSQIVADITGLLYLGSLYDRALFFSQYNRKIYQFTGDSILTVFMECNAIAEINTVNYIPMSNSIILSAIEADNTKAVYIVQQNNMIRLENVNFKRIFTTENENDSIILVDDDKIVSLNNEEYAGFAKEKLKVETCYFGIGQEQKSVFSCYYIRLFDENKRAGIVKARMYTLTDDEETTLEKTVEVLAPDWTDGGTLLLKFQPALQEATATKLYIESDFDIQNIYAEFNATGTQTGAKTRLEF